MVVVRGDDDDDVDDDEHRVVLHLRQVVDVETLYLKQHNILYGKEKCGVSQSNQLGKIVRPRDRAYQIKNKQRESAVLWNETAFDVRPIDGRFSAALFR
jgi:hypothetical protein